MLRLLRATLFVSIAGLGPAAIGQANVRPPLAPIRVCPGAFPTDLTATMDCRYTASRRSLDYLTGSVTDQAVLGAVVFGLGAQVIQSPSEWKRTWYGYGMRVGSRYTQAAGKGTAQYLVGLLMNDDPRLLAFRDDPRVLERRRSAICALEVNADPSHAAPCPGIAQESLDQLQHDGWQRFGHAWFDVITVRRSQADGNGRRLPAISRFAGEVGGAYVGYEWYPGAENTPVKVGQRAAGALGTAVLSSFYNEYKPEIANLLGALLRRGRQPKSSAGVHP